MNTKELIEKFYTSFSAGNFKQMAECYHDHIIFRDPAFGELYGERAVKMWEMLLSQKKEGPKITYTNIEANPKTGSAHWTATYVYRKRHVFNKVSEKLFSI